VEENARRGPSERPLYLLYDQVYWSLSFGSAVHVHPVGVLPAVAPYTIYIDGISKSLAATGVRVGWIVAPADLAGAMSALLGHVGAWAPKAEQRAVAEMLDDRGAMTTFRDEMTTAVRRRLDALFAALVAMRAAGLPVDTIAPAGAIYLSARFDLAGRRTRDGALLTDDESVRRWLLSEAGIAIVPFQAFGVPRDTGWYRLSVGAVSMEQIGRALPRLEAAIRGLSAA
jgi:aspartate aminotransferase